MFWVVDIRRMTSIVGDEVDWIYKLGHAAKVLACGWSCDAVHWEVRDGLAIKLYPWVVNGGMCWRKRSGSRRDIVVSVAAIECGIVLFKKVTIIWGNSGREGGGGACGGLASL